MKVYDKSMFANNTYSYGKKDVNHLKYIINSLRIKFIESKPIYRTPSNGYGSTTVWSSNNNGFSYHIDPYQISIRNEDNYDECDGSTYDLYVIHVLSLDRVKSIKEYFKSDIFYLNTVKKWFYKFKLGSYKQSTFRSDKGKLFV